MVSSNSDAKVALVTGAARGIGRASASALARDGVDVFLGDIDLEVAQQTAGEIAAETGVRTAARLVDVRDLQTVKDVVAEAEEKYGGVDILVNNAGVISDTLLARMSDEQWDRVLSTNLTGTFYCTRAVMRDMLRKRWGRIINISSIVGERGNPGQTNYAASKAGLNGFTKSLAKEVANRNITVNAVAPGYIKTDTVDVIPQKVKDRVLSLIPGGHFGEAEDVGYMVAFLASERARYVTGQVIGIDGGLAI